MILFVHGVSARITSTQLCMLIKGTMQDPKVITLESRGALAETGTLRDGSVGNVR